VRPAAGVAAAAAAAAATDARRRPLAPLPVHPAALLVGANPLTRSCPCPAVYSICLCARGAWVWAGDARLSTVDLALGLGALFFLSYCKPPHGGPSATAL